MAPTRLHYFTNNPSLPTLYHPHPTTKSSLLHLLSSDQAARSAAGWRHIALHAWRWHLGHQPGLHDGVQPPIILLLLLLLLRHALSAAARRSRPPSPGHRTLPPGAAQLAYEVLLDFWVAKRARAENLCRWAKRNGTSYLKRKAFPQQWTVKRKGK